MSTGAVEFEAQGAIAVIRLNRIDAGNTINDAAITAFEAIIERFDSGREIKVVILTGAGSNTFCAGGDFHYFLTLDTREAGLSRLIYESDSNDVARYEREVFADLWVSEEFRRVISELQNSRAAREPEK